DHDHRRPAYRPSRIGRFRHEQSHSHAGTIRPAHGIKETDEMKAACWMGKEDIQVLEVPDPKIINPRDVIVRITRTAICGSDLHLYNGFMPTMMAGDIVGHEFMGEVVEKGPEVKKLNVGDKVCV